MGSPRTPRPPRRLLAALLVASALGCGEPLSAPDGAPLDAAPSMIDADPPMPDDGRPTPDLGPPPPDAGPPDAPIRIGPWPVRLVEGRPGAFTVRLTADAAGPVRVTASGFDMRPPALDLDPAGPTEAAVVLTAPVDADEAGGSGALLAEAGEQRWTVELPIVDVHHTLELVMTPEQVAGVRAERSRDTRYVVGTRLDGVDGPQAEFNLRGKGTFYCARRSFTVRFETPVRIADSHPLEHVTLLSMCEDTPYLRMHSSAAVMRAAGIWPMWSGYVELRYGGATRGVYLAIERPRKAAERLAGRDTLVIRRLGDAEEEIKTPDADDIADREALLAPYRALYRLAEAVRGEALLDQLDRRMHYDAYLDWLALNSVLENGDYIDEVYLFDRPGPPGSAEPWFDIMPWDYDGVQTRCHVGDPIPEPLMYCAESGLDLPVSRDPAVQARYLARLETLLAGPLAPSAYAEAVRRSAAELAVYLERPGVRDIMTRDGVAPDPMVDADAMIERQRARVDALRSLMP